VSTLKCRRLARADQYCLDLTAGIGFGDKIVARDFVPTKAALTEVALQLYVAIDGSALAAAGLPMSVKRILGKTVH
jgi:hypothetical protein